VRHLALAADGPDADLAARLATAAQEACLRGAAVAGAELADLALRLTSADQAAARVARLLDAGRLHLAAFDPESARELLEQAIELSGPGPLRATALHHLGRVTGYLEGPAASLPVLRRALAEAGEGTALDAEIHRDLGFVLGISTENFTTEPVEQFLAASETAMRLGDEGLVSQLLAFRALAEFVTGHGVRRDLAGRAQATRPRGARVPMELRPRVLVSHILRCSDDLAGARALLTAEYAEAIEQGAETDLPFLILHLAELETWAGNYGLAEEYADHIHDLTSGKSFTVAKSCPSCLSSSAEVTAGSPGGIPPADFTAVKFTGIVVTGGGVTGGLANAAWNTGKLSQPGSPHTVAGPPHTFSARPIRSSPTPGRPDRARPARRGGHRGRWPPRRHVAASARRRCSRKSRSAAFPACSMAIW
jgi:hypothetical protein